jgi:hypothetical protein
MGKVFGTFGKMRNAYKILVRKPECKSPLVRPRHRWEDNIKIYLMEIRCVCVYWIHVSRGRALWWVLGTQ